MTVEAEINGEGRSLIVVYAWQDEAHHDYAHIPVDAGGQPERSQRHVFRLGGERVRISSLDGRGALPSPDRTPVKLVFDRERGRCYVEVGASGIRVSMPSTSVCDGQGSAWIFFDETGSFRNVNVTGR